MFRLGKNLLIISKLRSRAISAYYNSVQIDEPIQEDYDNEYKALLSAFDYKNVSPPDGKLQLVLRQLSRCQVDKEYSKKLLKRKDVLLEAAKKKELFNICRLIIDDYEESFPQPYDDDFEQTKVPYDKEKLAAKVGLDLHEERRRQKWDHYLSNPPNEKMTNLAKHLVTENISYELFSEGIAKAYHLFSDKFYAGFVKVTFVDPKKCFIYKRVVVALRVILKEEDILDELIDIVAPKIETKSN